MGMTGKKEPDGFSVRGVAAIYDWRTKENPFSVLPVVQSGKRRDSKHRIENRPTPRVEPMIDG